MKAEKINLSDKFGKLPVGDYAVGLIAKMNDYEIKIVKFKGDFVIIKAGNKGRFAFIGEKSDEIDLTFQSLTGKLLSNKN